MTANTVKVACLGYVFDPIARGIVREIAPPEFELLFAEKPDETTPALVAESDFVLCVSHVTDAMMAGAPKLRLIQKWGIGVDKIDLEAADRHGIYVAITAGANASVVAEHTIMLILAILRRLPVADRAIRQGVWSAAMIRPHARQLAGKTVGILGLGNIGRALAKRLRGFDVQVIYYDIKGPFDYAKDLDASFVSFDELIARSDILTLHIPGGKKNTNVVDAGVIARMKPGSFLINAARGELIEENALAEALTSGHLMGAAVDTFAKEPLRDGAPFRAMDNIVMTPHAAGGVLDHVGPMARHAFRNMQAFLNNQPLVAADWIVVPANPRPGYTGVVPELEG